jgi:radical SAM superfamily enzyme YgiQ (UPF0313 family)
MKVLLISANTEKMNMPTIPVGLAYVASAARRAGHEVILLDLMFERNPLEAIRKKISELSPDAIGISVRNIDDQSYQAPRFLLEQVKPVIAECRSGSSAPIILGGAGYSLFPDAALTYLKADLGIEGDGETVFPLLLERLAKQAELSDLPGVHVAGHTGGVPPVFTQDLNICNFPDQEILSCADPCRTDVWVPVQTRRGCPNNCSYCATFRIQGRTIRSCAPQIIVDGIGRLAQAGFRQFYFVDNSFNIPESHALELCRALKSITTDLRWRCIIYPEKVSKELVEAMAASGCDEVALGFESGNEIVLRAFNKRFSPDEVRRTSDLCAEHGIRRTGFLLFGGPGETRQSVEESLAFAQSLHLDALRVTVGIRLYPHTPLARRAVEEGMVEADDDLLFPRFYLAPGLEPWIYDKVTPGMRRIS